MTALDPKRVQDILREYDDRRELFQDLAATCEGLIRQLLQVQEIEFHSVNGRVKDKVKLHEKLTREGKNYKKLAEVTDVVGIRVITHFESEIDNIGSLLEGEFDIDKDNSVDKRQILAPDRFGYLSVHYVCSLTPRRLTLKENQRFRNLKFEIQVRSILQHAWAEIEHDLGYKSDHEVPRPIRRRFSRIAGLLEIADQEFAAIRNELHKYESEVETAVKTAPGDVGIDNISLKTICEQNVVVRGIDEELAKNIRAKVKEDNASILPLLSKGLPSIGINTVEQLIEALKKHRELLLHQATARFKDKGFRTVDQGVSVLQLLWVLMGLQGGEERIISGRVDVGLVDLQQNQEFAREVMQRIREFQKRR